MQEEETITFKSTPENWNKESIGLKRNTVRKIDYGDRFWIMDLWMCAKIKKLFIVIEQTTNGDKFKREVTDVSKINDYYIVSW